MSEQEPGTSASAEEALREWARNYARRDDLIRQAHASNVNNRRIAQLMGISRTTVYTVLGEDDSTPDSPRSPGR